MKIRQNMYVMSEARVLVNIIINNHAENTGYYEATYTLGIFIKSWRLDNITLVLGGFGVTYTSK